MPIMMLRRDAGLSLIELMVALLLLAVALMGLAAAFAPGRMAIQGGDQATTATFLARRVLEDMRNRAYDLDTDELVNGPTFPATTPYGGITLDGIAYPRYRRTITIVNNAPEVGTKTVTVSVFFRNSSGTEQAVTLTMIFTQET
jgi:prepilin-type N-terminal cleavage/methylation domain-containing protein